MKRNWKCTGRWGIALLALCAGFVLAPASRAQAPAASTAQSQTQANTGTQTATDTQQRLQDLEKEVNLLQSEIASLKEEDDSTAASVKTAALNTSGGSGRAADAPAPISLTSLLGPMTISGEVDGYYAFNFNQPNPLGNAIIPGGFTGNSLQAFDNNTNQFSLNAVELVVDRAPDATVGGTGRAGFHVGVIYGQAAEAVNGTTLNYLFSGGTAGNATDVNNIALKEAYVDYIAPVGKGLTLTVGKFVTPAGAEVIESNGNWNYSRSILFYYAIPYFHFGAKAAYAFNSKWSVTGFLVNGWNNSQAVNTGKTYGASVAYTPNAKWSVIETYLAGPQDDAFLNGAAGGPNDNWRQLEDLVVSYTPNAKWSFILNGDYGYGDKYLEPYPSTATSPAVSWYGVAGYVKYTLSGKSYVAIRGEYFADPDGFMLFGLGSLNGHVSEGTATYAYNLTRDLQTRFEFRDDISNRYIFLKGTRYVETQPVAEVGFIYSFSSANAH
ncbi:MAG: outer membrane beta-barrel protein [Candidatus Acidiferrales bacterium]